VGRIWNDELLVGAACVAPTGGASLLCCRGGWAGRSCVAGRRGGTAVALGNTSGACCAPTGGASRKVIGGWAGGRCTLAGGLAALLPPLLPVVAAPPTLAAPPDVGAPPTLAVPLLPDVGAPPTLAVPLVPAAVAPATLLGPPLGLLDALDAAAGAPPVLAPGSNAG